MQCTGSKKTYKQVHITPTAKPDIEVQAHLCFIFITY